MKNNILNRALDQENIKLKHFYSKNKGLSIEKPSENINPNAHFRRSSYNFGEKPKEDNQGTYNPFENEVLKLEQTNNIFMSMH